MDLATLWFGLAVLSWVLFFVLEGFDFGVGMLSPLLGRSEHERSAALRTIGPVWDGNEVWLVAAIGVTFAAFPDWYAALLSGLYLPMVLVLLGLAVRGVALEFRGKHDDARWRRRADAALAVSSALIAALFGAILAVMGTGLAIGANGEVTGGALARTVAPLLTPAALVGAALGLVGMAAIGASFLALRTTGPLRERAGRVGRTLLTLLAVAALALGLWALVTGVVPGAVAALLVALLAAASAIVLASGREALAFGLVAAGTATTVVGVLAARLPVLLPSTLSDAWSVTTDAAASDTALVTISVGALVILPGVVAYQAYSYWVFRRRVASERVAA